MHQWTQVDALRPHKDTLGLQKNGSPHNLSFLQQKSRLSLLTKALGTLILKTKQIILLPSFTPLDLNQIPTLESTTPPRFCPSNSRQSQSLKLKEKK